MNQPTTSRAGQSNAQIIGVHVGFFVPDFRTYRGVQDITSRTSPVEIGGP